MKCITITLLITVNFLYHQVLLKYFTVVLKLKNMQICINLITWLWGKYKGYILTFVTDPANWENIKKFALINKISTPLNLIDATGRGIVYCMVKVMNKIDNTTSVYFNVEERRAINNRNIRKRVTIVKKNSGRIVHIHVSTSE